MPFSGKCCWEAIAKHEPGLVKISSASQAEDSDMKRLTILAAAITVGAVAPAAAADLPARAPASYKAPAIVEAAYDWSGFYVGINGGGATSDVDWNADPTPG